MSPHNRDKQLKPNSVPSGFQSHSTPNLSSLSNHESESRQLNNRPEDGTTTTSSLHPDQAIAVSPDPSADNMTSPSEPASIEDLSLDFGNEPPSLSLGTSEEEDDSAEEDDDSPVSNLPGPPMLSQQHSRSYTYLAPSTFAPPFYNRPPTPLPPSPSLTSLFRPNFSSQNSRPTTPDPSSDEGGASHTRGEATGSHTPNSAAASTLTSTFRSAKPIPRASPKVPTYEYYGFTLYLTSSLAFIVYLLWAFLPSPFLHQLGIYYYPNRWWALAIPAWTVMLIVYIYVALASYNVGYLTLPLQSVECLVDEAANVAVIDGSGNITKTERPSWQDLNSDRSKNKKGSGGGAVKKKPSSQNNSNKALMSQELDWCSLWNEGTDAVMDIPIGGVCEILYGMRNDLDDTRYDDEE